MTGGKDMWEWGLTFRLPAQRFGQAIKPFFREIMNAERVQVGYLGGFITRPALHVHVVAVGYNKSGRSLVDVDKRKWERRWGEIVGLRMNALKIDDIYEPGGAVGYLQRNLRLDPDSAPFFYNKKLLQRLELI